MAKNSKNQQMVNITLYPKDMENMQQIATRLTRRGVPGVQRADGTPIISSLFRYLIDMEMSKTVNENRSNIKTNEQESS